METNNQQTVKTEISDRTENFTNVYITTAAIKQECNSRHDYQQDSGAQESTWNAASDDRHKSVRQESSSPLDVTSPEAEKFNWTAALIKVTKTFGSSDLMDVKSKVKSEDLTCPLVKQEPHTSSDSNQSIESGNIDKIIGSTEPIVETDVATEDIRWPLEEPPTSYDNTAIVDSEQSCASENIERLNECHIDLSDISHRLSESGCLNVTSALIKNSSGTHSCPRCYSTFSHWTLLQRHLYKQHSLIQHVGKEDTESDSGRFTHTRTNEDNRTSTKTDDIFNDVSCSQDEQTELCKLNRTTEVKSFECDICMKYFRERCSLVTHMKIHTKEKSFLCDVCNKCFSWKCNIVKHMRIHSKEKTFQCDVCKKCFLHKCNLVEHMRIHTKEKPFQCYVCKKFFSQRSALVKHIRIHTQEKPFQCDVCMKCFSQSGILVEHMRIHTKEKPFQCYVCKKFLSQRGALVRHIRIHTQEKPFECDVCKKCFIEGGNLIKHMRIHTEEKPFQCDVCKTFFSQSSTLVRHMRIHTEEKPFQCDVCKKCFSQTSSLVQHMRIHTEEKPFKCDVCKKCFSRSSTLVRHMRIHTEEKPFVCDVCTKCFSQRGNLVEHMRIHTKRESISMLCM